MKSNVLAEMCQIAIVVLEIWTMSINLNQILTMLKCYIEANQISWVNPANWFLKYELGLEKTNISVVHH